MTNQYLKIDGTVEEVKTVHTGGYLPMVETWDGLEYYVAEDIDTAGEAAKEYWKDMAENDPSEFACIVGEQTLVSWALNQYAGPGSVQVRNLAEWLDVVADHPEEEFASYDGNELTIQRVGTLADALGFTPTIAYRHN